MRKIRGPNPDGLRGALWHAGTRRMGRQYGEFAGMRCKPWRWLWGLLPLALLAIAALLHSRSAIEADLQERTRYALEEAGLDWASSSFVGRDAAMTGEAVDESDRERALDLVRNTWGVRVAEDKAALAAEIRPYTWSALRANDRMRLEGYVPDDSERRQIVELAQRTLSDVRVSDRLEVGRGVPNRDRWSKAVAFALKQLDGLEDGEVSLSDLALSVRGKAKSAQSYRAVKTALAGNLPRGVKLALADITAPVADPYLLNVTFADGRVAIDGHAADDQSIAAIAAAAKRAFPKVRADVKLEVADGAPENWRAAAETIFAEMAKLTEGFATIRNESIDFSGTAETQETAEEVMHRVEDGVPSNFRAQANVTFKKSQLAEVKPYTLNATYTDGALSVEGYAPDDATVSAIDSQARNRFKSTTSSVRLELGAGAPEGWREAAVGMLGELARLEEGFAAIRDTTVDVTGVAKDQATADVVKSTIETGMPAGYRGTASITVKAEEIAEIRPYTFSVDYDGKQTLLEGYVPSEEDRGELKRYVERTFPGVVIIERLQLGAGAPAGFRDAAETGLSQLGRLEEGRMAMRDTEVVITGVAREQRHADSVGAELRSGLPSRFRGIAHITVAEAPVPEIEPYVWSADFDGRTVSLEGYVQSEDDRAEVVSETRRRLANAEVDDRMQIGKSRVDAQIWLQRVDYALEQLGRLNPGRVELSNDRFSIRGVAVDSAAYRAATTALKTMPPGLRLASEDITAPVPDSFTWTLDVRDSGIVLGGFVPSDDSREEIVNEVRRNFPGRKPEDRMEIAGGLDGSEADWLKAAKLGIRAAAMVGDGRVTLDGKRLTVTGTTDVQDLPGRVADMVGSDLPSDYDGTATIEYIGPSEDEILKEKAEEQARLAEQERIKEEKARNYRWAATYDGLHLEFDGAVPGDDERDRILSRARSLLPGRTFDDRAREEEGAPDGWLDAVLAGLEQLAGLESGRLEVVGLKIMLHGTTDNEETLARVRETLKSGLPRGYEGDNEVTYVAPPEPDEEEVKKAEAKQNKVDVSTVEKEIETTSNTIAPEECEAVLNSRVKRGKLFFRRDSARLDSRDQKIIEPLSKVLDRCPEATILIVGHTDSDGAAAYNQRLSEQRAQAVVAFLVSIGVDEQRLTAIGYGETKPVARNRGRANKARNRRIEFEVQLR
jgi:outer membrane protein OmpA-like peptidoglycan-associated protein/osmotically-inducible protein OsmY